MKTVVHKFELLASVVLASFILSTTIARSQPMGGIVSIHNIDFVGNNIVIDSFDSSDSSKSIWLTNSFYRGANYGIWSNSLSLGGASPSRTANAFVATGDVGIDVHNALIYGYIDSGPGGIDTFSSHGSVGDFTWVPTTGIQAGHSRDDIKVLFNSKPLPVPANSFQTTWLPLPSPTNQTIVISGVVYTNLNYPNLSQGRYTIRGKTYTYVITNRFYGIGANPNVYYQYGMPLNTTFSDSLFIDASNVVIFLTNGMYAPTITLNTNGDVQFWSMRDIFVPGNGEIDNQTGNAHAFAIYDVIGHPLAITFHGNGIGVGYIYAPSSDMTFAGGPGAGDMVGAIFCNSITIGGTCHFHFDETLATVLPNPPALSPLFPQAVPAGTNVTFSIISQGATPISYFWFFNQTNFIGGTNLTSLTLTNVQPSDSGNYSLIATNAFGSATSAPVVLFIYTNSSQLIPQVASPTNVNGRFQFDVNGVAGIPYSIETSTNLIGWIFQSRRTSPFSYTNFNTGSPYRFFRAVYP